VLFHGRRHTSPGQRPMSAHSYIAAIFVVCTMDG
jgi:hypothetical protein